MSSCTLCSRPVWRGIYCERHHPATDPDHIKMLRKTGRVSEHDRRAESLYSDYWDANDRAQIQMGMDSKRNAPEHRQATPPVGSPGCEREGGE